MVRLTGKQALVEMLRAEGVGVVFGNPGTTEMPLMDALQDAPDIRYILSLQEASTIGMADGYARATGKPAFCNVHITVGLANATSALYNAFKGGTPLVVTAGQLDTHLQIQDPLIGSNMADNTRFTKWSAEVPHVRELPMAVRRAFKIAKTPPTGPVFLSLPWNVLDEEEDVDIVPSSPGYHRIRPDATAVEKAARLMAKAQNPLLLVGDRVAQSGAVSEAVALAELLGARVHAGSFTEVNFPTSHPQYLGAVSWVWPGQRMATSFENVDVLVAVGTDLFPAFFYTSGPPIGRNTKIIHLDSKEWDIEKKYPVEIGMVGDPKAGLQDMVAALEDAMNGENREAARARASAIGEQKARSRQAFQQRVKANWNNPKISPERMMTELAQVMPKDAIMAAEASTTGGALMGAMDFDRPGDYYSARGGALGWGIPGAIGVKLANPHRPVVAVVADGSSMYTVQGLWTASRYNIPVTYVICNNASYRILKQGMAMYLTDTGRESQYLGMNFQELPLNLAKMAEAFNMEGIRVEKGDDLRRAYEKALSSNRPTLVDVVIDNTLPVRDIQDDYRPFAPKR
ncbi:MAG: thiamine pyrophosphate-binding protein [Dehalococcoidia bacterium]|nr:thiamine pyrophosphate-binding protein [Dehalococcoidia bacterium]